MPELHTPFENRGKDHWMTDSDPTPMHLNIGFVSTRFAGTDGVTLEASKWSDVLESNHHRCFWFAGELDRAADGQSGLQKALSGDYCLVILDLMLPEMDGWEVCEQIRLNPDYRSVKIAFLTARGDEAEVARGLALGADAYITKPFSNDQLIAKVKSLLEDTCEETGK